MYLVDNPANRRHHEMGEKHKKRMQEAIDKAKISAHIPTQQTTNSFYSNQGNSKKDQEKVFPETKQVYNINKDINSYSIPMHSYSANLSTPAVLATKKASSRISFSFKSRKIDTDKDQEIPPDKDQEKKSYIKSSPETSESCVSSHATCNFTAN